MKAGETGLSLSWGSYGTIADCHFRKAPYQDWQDAKQEIIVRLAEREREAQRAEKPLTDFLKHAIARDTTVDFWRRRLRHPVDSLNIPIRNAEGEVIGEAIDFLIAPHKDLEGWQFAKVVLEHLPAKLVRIGAKRLAGMKLTNAEQVYLLKMRGYRQKQMLLGL